MFYLVFLNKIKKITNEIKYTIVIINQTENPKKSDETNLDIAI
jgi:hypothetical protein